MSELRGEIVNRSSWASVTGTVVGTVWFGGNFGLVSLLIFSFEMARALSTFQHVLRPLGGSSPPRQRKEYETRFVKKKTENPHFLFYLMLSAPGPCKAARHCTLASQFYCARLCDSSWILMAFSLASQLLLVV